MLRGELETQAESEEICYNGLVEKLERQCRVCDNLRTDKSAIDEYVRHTTDSIDGVTRKMSGKQKKELDRQIANLKDLHKYLLQDCSEMKKLEILQSEVKQSRETIDFYRGYITQRVQNVCTFLTDRGLIDTKDELVTLTRKGTIAAQISEVNCIVMVEILSEWNYFAEFSAIQIVGFLSLFSDVRVNEEQRTSIVKTSDGFLKEKMANIGEFIDSLADLERTYDFNSGANYNIVYDMISPMMEWCDLQDEQQCKYFIQTRLKELEVGLGDFCKGIMKVNCIARELTKICITQGDSEAYEKMVHIETLLVKFVATNQSLYV
jgi:hypothetical protein